MNDSSHLNPAVEKITDADKEKRLYYIRSPQWIGYSLANRIMERLNALYNYPPSHRAPNMLIVGETNNGKTMIAKRFLDISQKQQIELPERLHMPVLMMSSPTSGEAGHFYSTILQRIGAKCGPRDTMAEKEFQILSLFKELNIKMLIIDEIHEVVQGGPRKQRNLLNVIKNLTNELQIPLVGLGTLDALHAVQAVPQLANRFRPVKLPRWQKDTDYLKLLATYEYLLPLRKKSNLVSNTIADKILRMSEGFIGEISMIITEAACIAVTEGEEKITIDILKSIEWETASQRKSVF